MSTDSKDGAPTGETGLPEITKTAETSKASRKAFSGQIPNDWIENPSQEDYGWDYIVTIPSAPGRVGPDFFVQLKGSLSVDYLADGQHVSFPLEVSTVQWLNSKPMPSAIAVCDVAAADRPIYWAWIREAIRPFEQDGDEWRRQKTVSLRIPVANRLSESHARIAADVNAWYRDLEMSRVVAEVVNPLIPLPKQSPLPPRTLVAQRLVPALVSVGLADVGDDGTLEPVSPEERETQAALRATGKLLMKLHDEAARADLEELRSKATAGGNRTRAYFANCLGILHLHDGDAVGALAKFKEAAALDAREPKFATNVLSVEHLLAREGAESLPTDWDERLNTLLTAHPGFVPAHINKARRLADTSLDDAESAIRASAIFPDNRGDFLGLLAELNTEPRPDDALRLIAELEASGAPLSALQHSVKGALLLAKAVGQKPPIVEINLQGLGPSLIDFSLLRDAGAAYNAAVDDLKARGFPRLADTIVHNACAVSLLLAMPQVAVRHARAFLERHPRSAHVAEILSLALVHVGEAREATEHAVSAYDLEPTPRHFRNMLLTLLNADAHEDLTDRVAERRARGTLSDDEERFAAQALAIAQASLGDDRTADDQLAVLRRLDADMAVATEVSVRRIRGESKQQVADALRSAIAANGPSNALLTSLLQQLVPPTDSTSAEVVAVAEKLAELRQLWHEEAFALGRAFDILGRADKAEAIFATARSRFPNEVKFTYEHAQALTKLGREEDAYFALKDFVRVAGRSYETSRNLALLAKLTGRIDEAIGLFQSALARSTDPTEKGVIHFQLFGLRMRRGDTPADCWRELQAFGETTKPNTEDEARYLTAGLFVPLREEDLRDDKIAASLRSYQERLSAFADANPKFRGFQRITAPAGASDKEAAEHLLTEIAALTLPERLRNAQKELAARGMPWPLSMRKAIHGHASIFEYWEHCVRSDEYADAVHAYIPADDIDKAAQAVMWDRAVSLDVTTLLTLQHLGILDEVTDLLTQIVLPETFRSLLTFESAGLKPTHPLVLRLLAWQAKYRSKIRVRRRAIASGEVQETGPYVLRNGVWTPRERALSDVLDDGVGEAADLAAQLGIPLYSDEAVVRHWARQRGVTSFGTVALLRKLRQVERLTPEDETKLIATLISSNHRHIPYELGHPHSRLTALAGATPDAPGLEQLLQDAVLGAFLRDLRTSDLPSAGVTRFVFNWIVLLVAQAVPDRTRVELTSHLVFLLVQRSEEGVILGIQRDRLEQVTARIGAALLLEFVSKGSRYVPQAWSLLKSVVERLNRTSAAKADEILFTLMPDAVLDIAKKRGDELLALAASVSSYFPDDDRTKWDRRIVERLLRA